MAADTANALRDVDNDMLLRANPERVSTKRDPAARLAAVEGLYSEDPVLCELDALVIERAAVSQAAGAAVRQQLGADFRFTPATSAAGHHGVGVPRWQGSTGTAVMVTGMDVAEIAEGRIVPLSGSLSTRRRAEGHRRPRHPGRSPDKSVAGRGGFC